MQEKPNRVQTAVELAYDLTKNNITGSNLEGKYALRWFPFVATLFFWIWFSNMLGYLPLPTNTEHPVDIFGVEVPSFAIYAATANISIPLVLTLVVWLSYHVEGIRDKGLIGYFKSWLPGGIEDMPLPFKAFVFVIECISHFVRLISLSVRLFANILAGHLLLLFMGGGLAVLLGLAALGVAHLRRRRSSSSSSRWAWSQRFRRSSSPPSPRSTSAARSPKATRKELFGMVEVLPLIAQSTETVTDTGVTDAGKAIALGIGAGLGSIGAGIGVGFIFGKEIESVARQPEMKDELQQIRWLGFALTEAVAFYTFIFGLIAFFL